jgi:hypothetical protein
MTVKWFTEGLSPTAKAYILKHIRLAWRYYSLPRKAVGKMPCAKCNHSPPSLADHIDPVVDPLVGFDGFDSHVKRMFGGALQPLCDDCHDKKTKEEMEVRKATRRAKKAKGATLETQKA